MLRTTHGARRYNEQITLTKSAVTIDDYGHTAVGVAVPVLDVFASVKQLSATKTMLTFQQADVIGVELEFRNAGVDFNGITWKDKAIVFSQPEALDRGRILRVLGYYVTDNPSV